MQPLLRLENISKDFMVKGNRKIAALQDINLEVYKGETLGIIGESGCGKSTLARVIMGVYPPSKGKVYFQGENLDLTKRKNRLAFGEKAQMIFQDPYTSLNPRMKVEDIVGENMVIHNKFSQNERKEKVKELLEAVGLHSSFAKRFPNEFSGGQRQRIGIARAIALNPKLLICDEPISALDVSIQSQIMNLLKDLEEKLGLTYIFIAHDMNMVNYISKRIAVMYEGNIVEFGYAKDIRENPYHPYTKLLWSAVLSTNPEEKKDYDISKSRIIFKKNENPACHFADQCGFADDKCIYEKPILKKIKDQHWVACHNSKCNM